MLDSSGSVGYNHFQQMKLFVKDLTDFYKLGPEETRVSVMSFSSSAYIHIPFSRNFSDKNQFDSAVDEIGYDNGGTATAIALNMAYNDMFTSRYGARGTGRDLVIWLSNSDNQLEMSYKIYISPFWKQFFYILRDQKGFGNLDGRSK